MIWILGIVGLLLVFVIISRAIPDPPANIGVGGDKRSPIEGELLPAELTATMRGVADGE